MIILVLMTTLYPLLYTPWLYDSYYLPKFILLFILAHAAIIDILIRRRSIEWQRLRNLPGKWWLAGFLILMTVSTIFSPYKNLAFMGEFFRHTGFLFYYFSFILFLYGYLIITKDKLRVLLKLFVVTAVPISIYGLLQHYGIQFSAHESQQFNYGYRSSSTIGNPNFMGTYIYLVFMVACFLYIKYENKIYLLGSLPIYACLLTTETRSVWLASFVIFVLLLVMNWKKKAFWMLCISLSLVSIMIFLSSNQLTHRISSTVDESINLEDAGHFGSSRGIIYMNGVQTLLEGSLKELLIGTGPDTFRERVIFSEEELGLYLNNHGVDKAHNIFLETLLTLGIPAFLCLYMFYIRLLTFKDKHSMSFYLSLLLIGYFVQGFFNIDVVSVYPMFILLLSGLAYSKMLRRNYNGL